MLFSSIIFLSIFLPIVVIIYFSFKKELRNYVLLAASLFFYGWGEPRFLAIMIFTIIFNYLIGVLIGFTNKKKLFISLGVSGNLIILTYFKYFNFFIDNLNKIASSNINHIKVIMPIGISFFIFQAISYIIDVYKEEVEAQVNPYNLALYISLFPQLIAGPIVKYHDVQNQIKDRKDTLENIYVGLKRFSFGLGKKILIANTLGAIADKVFALNINEVSLSLAWLGAICYSFQLYFDFSGYSDMAIGLGRIFGFHFLENFNYPYVSKSITEFWRRWHISLGSWFREYLYIPLGGNRKGQVRTYINLFIVFFATGFWHGASWNFIIWGGWHGLFLILERIFKIENKKSPLFILIRHIYTTLIVIFGWVLFRSETLPKAISYIKVMLGFKIEHVYKFYAIEYMTNFSFIIMVVALLLSIGLVKLLPKRNLLSYSIISDFWSVFITIVSFFAIASSTYNPFIYFRF